MSVEMVLDERGPVPFASAEDFKACQALHRKFGTTYFFASRWFPPMVRRRIDALYGFVRLPDEWVDNPQCDLAETRRLLGDYRTSLIQGLRGVTPKEPVLRAFCDVVRASGMPLDEPLLFLDSMEQDLSVDRYHTFEELRGYMRGSAASVGVMMCHLLCDPPEPRAIPYATALGEAMQMTNFLRDVGEDAQRSRIYLPLEDLARFSVCAEDVLAGRLSPEFKQLMAFEIARNREVYRYANQGISLLPDFAQKSVRLASFLYEKILVQIERADYDAFQKRARTSRTEKLAAAGRVLLGRPL